MRWLKAFVFGLALLGATGIALARPHHHGKPGNFDYYAMVLSWSPTFCESHHSRGHSGGECGHGKGRGFILHGFWPQYQKGWPLDCHMAKRPWVPQSVIEAMRDIMPDKGLVIHEYHAHGTCSGLPPAEYFATARTLFEKITIPAALESPAHGIEASPQSIKQEFLAANSWLQDNMIDVSCRKGKLLDVRICFSKDSKPTACGQNETQSRLCPLQTIEVPAARP